MKKIQTYNHANINSFQTVSGSLTRASKIIIRKSGPVVVSARKDGTSPANLARCVQGWEGRTMAPGLPSCRSGAPPPLPPTRGTTSLTSRQVRWEAWCEVQCEVQCQDKTYHAPIAFYCRGAREECHFENF